MKFRPRVSRTDLKRLFLPRADAVREAVADAAADALRAEVHAQAGVSTKITPRNAQRVVGSNDPEDAIREFGTLEKLPSPWLAPVLPLALEPMRAAAASRLRAAAREVFSRRKRKR